MAAGPLLRPDLAKLNCVNATALLAGTNYRAALVGSGWIPAPATNEVWADVSANEIAAGNGYTAGGGTLTGIALTQTAGIVKFTSAALVWTATIGSIPAFRYFVIYHLGTLNGKVNPLLAYALGDAAGINVPLTTVGNTITFTPNALGIFGG